MPCSPFHVSPWQLSTLGSYPVLFLFTLQGCEMQLENFTKTCLIFVNHTSYSPQLDFSSHLQSHHILSSYHSTFHFPWKLPEILLFPHPLNSHVLRQKAPGIFTQIFQKPRMPFSARPFIQSPCTRSSPLLLLMTELTT